MGKTVRQRLLGQVHIEKKRLRLGEDAYRDLLESLTGQRSAKDCTEPQLERVLIWIRTKFPVKQELPNGKSLSPTSRNRTEKTPADKMVALWIECYRAGAVQDRSHEALVSFAKGILGKSVVVLPGVDPLAALSPQKARAVIEALKAMLERANGKTSEERADGTGKTPGQGTGKGQSGQGDSVSGERVSAAGG